jgi:hypothetical protein
MAVLSTIVGTAMSIRYKAGLDSLGNDIIKAKKYPGIKVNAVTEDIFSIATAFGNLMRYEVVEILRSDDSLIASA